MNKTLIGKDNYLFLQNDSNKELEVHCNNLCLVKNKDLNHINKKNYFLVVYPNKSYYYKNFLPDKYKIKYRPAFDIYKSILNNIILDGYEFIKDVDDCFYKTDTHINLKGNYIIYKEFIKSINKLYNLN